MPVTILPHDSTMPLKTSKTIPAHYDKQVIVSAHKLMYTAGDYEYLEQSLVAPQVAASFYNLEAFKDVHTRPSISRGKLLIFLMTKGTVESHIHGLGRRIFREGFSYLLFFPSGVNHTTFFSKGIFEGVNIYLSKSVAQMVTKDDPPMAELISCLNEQSQLALMNKETPITPATREELDKIREYQGAKSYGDLNLLSCGARILFDHLTNTTLPHQLRHHVAEGSEKRRTANRAKQIVANYQKGKLSVADIAATLLISVPLLEHYYREYFNMTVLTDLLNKKLTIAKQLLEETDKRVYEIADDLGYEDRASLTRAFKRDLGIPPLKYRKLHRNAAKPPHAD